MERKSIIPISWTANVNPHSSVSSAQESMEYVFNGDAADVSHPIPTREVNSVPNG